MIKELEEAIDVAKTKWAELEERLVVQQRYLDSAVTTALEQENKIQQCDEDVERLTTLASLMTSQRDEARYKLGRVERALDDASHANNALQDDVKLLDRQVERLRATMGLDAA